jgi:hypothetical protein
MEPNKTRTAIKLLVVHLCRCCAEVPAATQTLVQTFLDLCKIKGSVICPGLG